MIALYHKRLNKTAGSVSNSSKMRVRNTMVDPAHTSFLKASKNWMSSSKAANTISPTKNSLKTDFTSFFLCFLGDFIMGRLQHHSAQIAAASLKLRDPVSSQELDEGKTALTPTVHLGGFLQWVALWYPARFIFMEPKMTWMIGGGTPRTLETSNFFGFVMFTISCFTW